MKIIYSIKGLNFSGGTERVTIIEANAMAERGHEVHIVSFVGKGEETFFSVSHKVKCHYLAPPKDCHLFPFRDIRRIVLLRKLYKQINPDFIIIVDAGRSFVNIPASRGYKTITWEHFNVGVNWHLGHHLSRKIAARWSDLIVTLTQPDAEAYKSEFGAKNAICIYNPITIDNSVPSSLTEKVCLAIGRLSPQKNFSHLLKAWAKTKSKDNGWRLLIVGNGEEESMLRSLISKLQLSSSVQLIEKQKDVISLYKGASLYAMSSHHEGLPLVLIEAMSMGLPIVSYDCPTGPADIVSNGETGILVPYLDIDALAASLDKVMLDDSLRKRYSAEALVQVNKFSVPTIVDMWVNTLNAL